MRSTPKRMWKRARVSIAGLCSIAGLWLVCGFLLSPASSFALGVEASQETQPSADEEHDQLFLENRFPASTACATCHPGQYRYPGLFCSSR